jgi:hypothetical protein
MSRFNPDRRRLLHALGASAALAGAAGIPGSSFAAAAGKPGKKLGRVVVIGAGFGGATAAKYLRKWSNGAIEVTLIERNKQFISCPASNEVLGGKPRLRFPGTQLRWPPEELGIRLVHASVTGIDADRRRVRTDSARGLRIRPSCPSRPALTSSTVAVRATTPRPRKRSCTPGKRVRRRWLYASSSKTCPTGALTYSPFRKRPIAARQAPTSAPARSPGTSRRTSHAPR